MKIILKLSLAFILLLVVGKAQAQLDGTLDTSFNMGTGFNNYVYTIVLQSDEKILVGGWFTEYNGQTTNRIVRLHTDGTIDTSFKIGIGFNHIVRTIALQPDGKILVGGDFTSNNGQTRNRIIRLNTDGTLDTSFNIGTGFIGTVNSNFVSTITIQPDGKILVGGACTLYNGQTQNYFARLNIDGSLDTSFNIGTGFNHFVHSIALQPDGKILAGGSFTSYNAQTRNHIIRLNTDGNLDTSFNIGTGFNHDVVQSITLQPDGKILVVGDFTSYNGQIRNRIIRLNTDGSLDTSFNIGTGFDTGNVHTIAIQPDEKLLVGGWFTKYNEQPRVSLVRLDTDGSLDTSLNIGTGFNNYVIKIALQPDGKILAGGSFTEYNGQITNHIVRLNDTNTMSIGDFEKSNVSIYPNPVSNEFKISVPSSNIEIFDISGKKVSEQENVSSSVDISHLLKGFYIVKAQTENGTHITKIVKQ